MIITDRLFPKGTVFNHQILSIIEEATKLSWHIPYSLRVESLTNHLHSYSNNNEQYIDNELENMSWLISQGGYIPFADHAIPPNSSWENFKYYRNSLNNIIQATNLI